MSMYMYVPSHLAASAPVVVALRPFGMSATSYFSSANVQPVVAGAETYGYIMVFPQTTNTGWDAGSVASLTHGGGSDSLGIVSMVNYAVSLCNADASRVYVMGTSSGGLMTSVLLGAYPDVFKAGSASSGAPFGCWADGYSSANQWSSSCAGGNVTKSAPLWGDLVRAAYPGYTGYRPRMQLWHGDADTTIKFTDLAEEVKQWTNVFGISGTPTTVETNTPSSGFTRSRYKNACSFTLVETNVLAGGGHGTAFNAAQLISFFALATSGPDPGTASCP
jgi:poly(hydroxyalkanoate) depolymerase family esterase